MGPKPPFDTFTGGMELERSTPKRRSSGAWGPCYFVYMNLPSYLLPGAMFVTVLLTLGFMETVVLGLLSVVLCFAVSVSAIYFARGQKWRILAIACLLVACLAVFVSVHLRLQFGEAQQRYMMSRWYTNVIPSEDPASRLDAGMLSFSADARVDKTMGVGYMDGGLWCAAPVVSDSAPDFAGFWAVGYDCCKERGRFNCGDVRNPAARSGVVAVDHAEVAKYEQAVRMAASAFELQVPERPIFVYWTSDVMGYVNGLDRLRVENVLGLALFVMFLAVVCAASLPFFGGDLVSEEMNFPDKETASMMHIGCDRTSCCLAGRDDLDDKEQVFAREMLHHKAYRSGEFLYDWIFHVCNNHMFVSCLAAHPSHAFSKFERLMVCLLVSALVVYPVSLISVQFGQEGFMRLVAILVLVTVPRSLLKTYLKQVTVEDAHAVEAGHRLDGSIARKAFMWEIFVFAVITVITVVVCVISHYRLEYEGYDPWATLAMNCDGLAIGFVTEFLLDFFMPHMIHTKRGDRLVMGFVMHWVTVRDEGFVLPTIPTRLKTIRSSFVHGKNYQSV